MSGQSGVTGLLAGAISYALGACALIEPGEMALPTPCPDWNLAMLLGHLSDSMADVETAIRTGRLDLDHPFGPADRFVQVKTPGAQRRLQVRHRLAQVADQHGQVPVRARRGQRQLGRPDRRADGEHVADRAGQQLDRAG